MAKYVRLVEGTPEVYSISQLKRDNPNVSFPEVLTEEVLSRHGVYEVVDAEKPSCDGNCQTVVEGPISLIGGKYTRTWVLRDKTDAEIAAHVRKHRDQILQASDHTQLEDAPGDKQAWAAYRQALRDITAQPGFPRNVVWPNAPGGSYLLINVRGSSSEYA